MSMFSFDRPVKMKAADQFGFSTSATVNRGNTRIAGGVNWDKANWINKTYGGKASNWYENNPNKPDASNPHVPAGSYFPRASLDTPKDTEIAGQKGTLQFYKENFMNQIDAGGGVENASEADQKRYKQYEKDLQKPKQNIFGEIFKIFSSKFKFLLPFITIICALLIASISSLKGPDGKTLPFPRS